MGMLVPRNLSGDVSRGDRIPSRGKTRGFDPGTAAIARAEAFIGGGGALVGMTGVLLPHPPQMNEPAMLAVQSVAIGTALILLASANRISLWILRAIPMFGTALVTANVAFSGDSTSAYVLFYLWLAIYAFNFLSRREAAVQIGVAALSYVAVVVLVRTPTGPSPHSEVTFLTLLIGTFLVMGIPVFFLRDRVERLWARLTDAAVTDLPTGLLNTRGINEALTTELERARLDDASVSVLVCDLDRFRLVNERVGHGKADELLRRVGAALDSATRRVDIVGRTAGAKFTIILPGLSGDEAYLVAEQLLGQVRHESRIQGPPVTASIGIATYPEHAVTVEELLKLATRALEVAKALGRDRAVVSSPVVLDVLSGALRQPKGTSSDLATILGMAEAFDLRDGGAAERSRTVGTYAAMTASELGLNQYRTERVRLAGILHDIGKLGVPDTILRKQGSLDEEEWEQIRRHPEIAARILGGSEVADIRGWVLASHEQPDGRGYPRGLAGDEIPLEARILAVAAAFEAMTTGRAYRPAIGEPAAREELRRCAGTQFDPEVVDAFLRAIDRELEPSRGH